MHGLCINETRLVLQILRVMGYKHTSMGHAHGGVQAHVPGPPGVGAEPKCVG